MRLQQQKQEIAKYCGTGINIKNRQMGNVNVTSDFLIKIFP